MNGTMLHEIAMRRNKIVVERWWCDAHVMPEGWWWTAWQERSAVMAAECQVRCAVDWYLWYEYKIAMIEVYRTGGQPQVMTTHPVWQAI